MARYYYYDIEERRKMDQVNDKFPAFHVIHVIHVIDSVYSDQPPCCRLSVLRMFTPKKCTG